MSRYTMSGPEWDGLAKLVEETGELQQVLGKLLQVEGDAARHWDGDLRPRLVEELADAKAALDFFAARNLTPDEMFLMGERWMEKMQLFERWAREEDPDQYLPEKP